MNGPKKTKVYDCLTKYGKYGKLHTDFMPLAGLEFHSLWSVQQKLIITLPLSQRH